ncbi:polymorphic toxin type 17 domain-containing protein [Paenactinomyces guangxiensis]|uniref:polymorphic toxin type 17 domain-containing protein n=1 Tax=Paenactinomyces guangxiensis TaxID=1490290 RepID=UPI0018DB0AA0|nr:hypothetical protein [Paenactinomyces guangxiensis]
MISEEVMDVMTRSYVYSSWGERMAMIKTDAAGTSYYQYNTDIDVEMLLDEQGNIRATYGYTPYGENDDAMFTGADEPDPSQPDKEMYNPFRYGGKRWDPYTESYDLGFRNYFPGVGRFMSPDSYTDSEQHKGLFMDAMTNSLYSFTDGNPVSYVDLDGHVPLGGDDACMRAPVSCYTANTGYYYDPAGPKRKAPPKAMKRAKRTLDTLRKKPVHNKNKGEQPPPRPKPKPVPINTFVYAKAGGYGYAAAPAYGREPLSPEAQLWVGGILFALAVIDPLPGDEALVAGALGYAGFRVKSILSEYRVPVSSGLGTPRRVTKGGSAASTSIRGMIKKAKLPTSGPFRFIPEKGATKLKTKKMGGKTGYVDRFGNVWVKGPYHGDRRLGFDREWDVQLSPTGKTIGGMTIAEVKDI